MRCSVALYMSMGLAIAAVSIPAGASAQSPDAVVSCGQILPCGGFSRHVFAEEQDMSRKNEPAAFHGECLRCQQWHNGEWVDVTPEHCHDPCTTGLLSLDEQDAYAATINAASALNLEALFAAGRRVSQRIRIHEGRRSIQVLDCEGLVVANLPLGESYTEAELVFGLAGNALVASR